MLTVSASYMDGSAEKSVVAGMKTRIRDSPIGVRIRIAAPLLVRVVTVASVNLEHIAVGNFPISEVDALVRAVPLEGRVRHGDPLLIGIGFACIAGPNLKFRAICVDTAGNVDTLEKSQGNSQQKR